MNDTEEQIRAATRAAAQTVHEIRPLDLSQDTLEVPVPRRGMRWHGVRHLRPWAAPLTAAAAVLMIAAALVAVKNLDTARPAGPAMAVTPAAAVPRYYVALNNPRDAKSPDQVVVGDTLTGKRVAMVSPPAHGTFGGVTAAADDRTFVLDVRQFPWSNTWMQVSPRTWYMLRIAPGTDRPIRLTKLRIPATPNGAQVNGIALSPDGSRLAVMYQPNAMGPAPSGVTLRIYAVPTGKLLRTWAGPTPSPSGLGVYLFGEGLYRDNNTTLSWTMGGRGLAFVYGSGLITDTTVRMLNLTAPGQSLLADSKLVLDLKPGSAPDCGSLLLTADGRTIVCGAALLAGGRSIGSCSAATGLAKPGIYEYSAATGKLTHVLYRYTGACLEGGAYALWVSSSGGGTVIGYLGITTQLKRPAGIGKYQTGIFTGGRFKPLTFPLAGGVPGPATIAF